MKARDVMTSPPITVTPDTAITDVAALLLERRISAVPVVDEHGRMVGIISEGDLLRRSESDTERRRPQWLEMLLDPNIQAADFVKTHGTHVGAVMTRDVVAVSPDTDLAEIASLLEQRRIKRVPVVENGVPVGIVSRANLLYGLVAYKKAPSGLQAASDPEIQQRVTESLRAEPWIDLSRLNIVVSDGVVHLWGLVKSEEQRRALKVAAGAVPGVRSVEDHLGLDRFPNFSG